MANSHPSGWINATLIFVIRHLIASRLRTAPCYATKCHITTPTPGLHAYIETGEPWPLARYVKLQVAHAPRIPGTFSPPSRVSDPDMHHGTCVTHVLWCIPGSLTSGFRWKSVGGNVPGIPGACATRNFTYLVRGPWGNGKMIMGLFVLKTRKCSFKGGVEWMYFTSKETPSSFIVFCSWLLYRHRGNHETTQENMVIMSHR